MVPSAGSVLVMHLYGLIVYSQTLHFLIQEFSNWQVWHEISVEAKHVKDIMSTLESFKLDSSPVKAAQHDFPAQDGEAWSLPVPVERR